MHMQCNADQHQPMRPGWTWAGDSQSLHSDHRPSDTSCAMTWHQIVVFEGERRRHLTSHRPEMGT